MGYYIYTMQLLDISLLPECYKMYQVKEFPELFEFNETISKPS